LTKNFQEEGRPYLFAAVKRDGHGPVHHSVPRLFVIGRMIGELPCYGCRRRFEDVVTVREPEMDVDLLAGIPLGEIQSDNQGKILSRNDFSNGYLQLSPPGLSPPPLGGQL
jgi:hypothetical protein